MNTFNLLVQYMGYLATALVIISLMMRSLVKLRIVNLLGGLLFAIYAIIIGAYPVVFLNISLVLINAYHLCIKISKEKLNIDILRIHGPELEQLDFYKKNQQDIERFFGVVNLADCNEIYLLLKNEHIAGILAGNRIHGKKTFEICIDYVASSYRDYKIGKFLFKHNTSLLSSRGITSVCINTSHSKHMQYLNRLGFTQKDTGVEEQGVHSFILELSEQT